MNIDQLLNQLLCSHIMKNNDDSTVILSKKEYYHWSTRTKYYVEKVAIECECIKCGKREWRTEERITI